MIQPLGGSNQIHTVDMNSAKVFGSVITEKEKERFWAKVTKDGPVPSGEFYKHLGGCWLWDGRLDRHGYGTFDFHGDPIGAHIFAYIIINGDVAGNCVLHECDVPRCVNPKHLHLGTKGDNTREATARNRFPVGEDRKHTKLTSSEVIEIRRLRKNGERSRKKLAQMFGISIAGIQGIIEGRTWKHLL